MKFIEAQLLEAGISPLAGVDEAGRGACAGPLVVASVILEDPLAPKYRPIRDSKELTEAAREDIYELIIDSALAVSVISIEPQEIDQRGVHAANLDGMRRAIQGLRIEPAYVLTDGYVIDGLALPNLAVWKGDQVATCISAASVIAKVTRDRWMKELDLKFPLYGFAQHKGYITKAHSSALVEHGPCVEHRRSFSNISALIKP